MTLVPTFVTHSHGISTYSLLPKKLNLPVLIPTTRNLIFPSSSIIKSIFEALSYFSALSRLKISYLSKSLKLLIELSGFFHNTQNPS